ncbi:MAG: ABC transporter ATP-binding protein [Cyclobacteriaceae bacterium]|nr:ABC transporter ATP-binding protein [Cyclobacteriaceae bacterium HetDA_MAG_MS6]
MQVSHITKRYGSQTVLKDVSFGIEKGTITALTGESGCGKTTLLRIIAGLDSPDQGLVSLNAKDITNWSAAKRRMGFVFQNLALFPHLNIEKNIGFGLKRNDKSRVSELLEMTGLSGLENRYPHELSGGQQQRVALARALAPSPQVLLLDEPFSSLDEIIKARVRNEVFEIIQSLGITTILVTHQAIDAFMIANQLIILREGKVLQKGSPSDIYQYPSTPYVSDFFGASVIMEASTHAPLEATTPFGVIDLASRPKSKKFQIFIRPENITIASEEDHQLKGIVKHKTFKGPHEILSISNANGDHQLEFETERSSIMIDDTIYLKIDSKFVQTFDSDISNTFRS